MKDRYEDFGLEWLSSQLRWCLDHAANALDLFHLPALKQQYTWEVF